MKRVCNHPSLDESSELAWELLKGTKPADLQKVTKELSQLEHNSRDTVFFRNLLLQRAAIDGSLDRVRYLHELGFKSGDLQQVHDKLPMWFWDAHYDKVLPFVANNGHLEVFRYMVEHGLGQVDVPDLLSSATEKNDVRMLRYLVNMFRAEITEDDLEDAIHVAEEIGLKECEVYLRSLCST